MYNNIEKASEIVLSAPMVIPKHKVLSWEDTIAYDEIKLKMREFNNKQRGEK